MDALPSLPALLLSALAIKEATFAFFALLLPFTPTPIFLFTGAGDGVSKSLSDSEPYRNRESAPNVTTIQQHSKKTYSSTVVVHTGRCSHRLHEAMKQRHCHFSYNKTQPAACNRQVPQTNPTNNLNQNRVRVYHWHFWLGGFGFSFGTCTKLGNSFRLGHSFAQRWCVVFFLKEAFPTGCLLKLCTHCNVTHGLFTACPGRPRRCFVQSLSNDLCPPLCHSLVQLSAFQPSYRLCQPWLYNLHSSPEQIRRKFKATTARRSNTIHNKVF